MREGDVGTEIAPIIDASQGQSGIVVDVRPQVVSVNELPRSMLGHARAVLRRSGTLIVAERFRLVERLS